MLDDRSPQLQSPTAANQSDRLTSQSAVRFAQIVLKNSNFRIDHN
jgi:hypothetical protein